MCVICYKAWDKKLPTEEKMRDMWDSNHDGAGIMWKTDKRSNVKFRKGFMTLASFLQFVKDNGKELERSEVAMHFRIGTHGGNTPGNTHPFVVKRDIDPHLIESNGSKVVLMHNGILPLQPRKEDISDTAELALRAADYKNPTKFLSDCSELLRGNKVIVMTRDNDAEFFGDEWKVGDDGLLYSNLNHEGWSSPRGLSMFGRAYYGYDDDDEYYDASARDWEARESKDERPGRDVIDFASVSSGEPGEETITAWDIDLPSWIKVWTDEGDTLARTVIEDTAETYIGTTSLTPYGWTLFMDEFRRDIEETFWNEFDIEEEPEATSAGK